MNNIDLGLKINAVIGQETTTIALSEKGKNLPHKVVSTNDFIKVISSIKNEDEREESPLFPSDYGTKKMVKSNNDYYFLITSPPGQREVSYSELNLERLCYYDEEDYETYVEEGDDSYYAIEEFLNDKDIYNYEEFRVKPYLPSLVWFIQVRKDVTDDSYRFVKDRIYSKEGTILSMQDDIYPAPLSNIYPDDKVCWGDVEIPKLTIPGLMALERIFFNVYSNMDLETTYTRAMDIGGYQFKSKFLHLVLSQDIYDNEGEESAARYINSLIRGARPNRTQTIEEVWNEFTR